MRALLALLLIVPAIAGCFGDSPDVVTEGVPDAFVSLSPVRFDAIVKEAGDAVSTLDGIPLHYDVWRPDTQERVPIILVQSPYWAFLGDAKDVENPTWYIDYFVPRGYAVVLGEMRGTRDSGGCWDFGGRLDQQDGYDMVEHLAAKPWSNGNVGMLGQSHVGMSQVAAGIMDPPSLKAIVPIAAVTDWYRYLHKDGAPYVLNRGTPPAYFAVHASPSTPDANGEGAPVNWLLTQAQTACVDNVVHLSQSAELDGDKDAYWQERDLIAGAGNTRAAVFLVHGFLDENVKTDHFLDYWNALPDDIPKKAWFGQWYHEHPSYVEWREDLHRWYDFHLKGIQNGIMDEPSVTVQDNRFVNRTEASWPANSVPMPWTLGDGVLGFEGASATQNYLSLPGDDRSALPRVDPAYEHHLAFSSEPLVRDLRITGEPWLNLTLSLASPDARLIAVLFDVGPNGGRDEISRAYLDARHRNGPENNDLIPPLEDVRYTLRFFPREHVVVEGNHMELVLFGGDMGCQAGVAPGTYTGTCEGTGILPVAAPAIPVLAAGRVNELWVPTVIQWGPERVLTPLENWLDDLPE